MQNSIQTYACIQLKHVAMGSDSVATLKFAPHLWAPSFHPSAFVLCVVRDKVDGPTFVVWLEANGIQPGRWQIRFYLLPKLPLPHW